MMSQFLRDALVDLLFRHMAVHIDNGLDYDEALILGVEEIRRQIRGTRLDLESLMINDAMAQVRALHPAGEKLH
jgi:hypothetical protein